MERLASAGSTSKSGASRPPGAFGIFPFEVLLPILKLAPDFSSLWSLVNASPAASAVFDATAFEVTEAVMAATTPAHTQSLLRTFINAEAFGRFPGLEEARELPKTAAVPAWEPQTGRHEGAHPSWPRRFLLTAHRVHTLAHGCIEYYMAATNRLEIRDLVELGPLQADSMYTTKRLETARSCPLESTFRWTHSWYEEQRASRCLWFIAFYFQLQRARKAGRLASWAADDLLTLASTPLVDFDTADRPPIGQSRVEFRHEQVVTVLEYLQGLPGFGTIEDDPLESVGRLAADRYFDSRVCASPPALVNEGFRGPRDVPFLREVQTTTAVFYNVELCGHSKKLFLAGTPFSAWRRFGFALWDSERMADLGLVTKKLTFYPFHACHRWYSIMNQQSETKEGNSGGG